MPARSVPAHSIPSRSVPARSVPAAPLGATATLGASIASRVRRLLGAKAGLDRTIREEQRRPAPDSLRLSALKAAKLRINDRLQRLGGFAANVAADVAAVPAEARLARRQVRRRGMIGA